MTNSDIVFLPPPKPHPLVALVRRPAFWVWVLILIFTVWFSAYSIRLHDAHLTYKADLGQMDLAIWNTSQGRLLQEIKGETVSTRLTDHVEPIFLPVSALFWLWDDVRALLILQAAALALGAWPIYLLARRRIAESAAAPAARMAEKAGLVFAAAYLLTPALQAPVAAEFHALPLAVPLIAWALWAVEDRRWVQFIAASVLVMSVQEGMALVAAALGVYATVREIGRRRAGPIAAAGSGRSARPVGAAVGVTVFILGLVVVLRHDVCRHPALRWVGLRHRTDALRRALRGAGRFVRRCAAVAGDPAVTGFEDRARTAAPALPVRAAGTHRVSGSVRRGDPLSRPAAAVGQPAQFFPAAVLRRAALFGAAGAHLYLRRSRRPGPPDPELQILARGFSGQPAPGVRHRVCVGSGDGLCAGLPGRGRLYTDRQGVPAEPARRLAAGDGPPAVA